MTRYIAFDTCALISLDDGDDEDVLTRTELLSTLYKGITRSLIHLLVDAEGQILGEYKRNLPPDSFGRRLTTVAIRYSAITSASSRPTRRCQTALDRDGFDPADIAFVGVAQAMGGVYVTTEEKHLTANRKRCILGGCGVDVLNLEEVQHLLLSDPNLRSLTR
ncbi:hypothetical protein ACIA7R_30975 [Micromonospora chalcea]